MWGATLCQAPTHPAVSLMDLGPPAAYHPHDSHAVALPSPGKVSVSPEVPKEGSFNRRWFLRPPGLPCLYPRRGSCVGHLGTA